MWQPNLDVIMVSSGAVTGALFRYKLTTFMSIKVPSYVATLGINAVGSFLLGFSVQLASSSLLSQKSLLLLGTGFCGSFTTLSTFSVDVLRLLEERSYLRAGSLIAATNVLGVSAAFAGVRIARWLPRVGGGKAKLF